MNVKYLFHVGEANSSNVKFTASLQRMSNSFPLLEKLTLMLMLMLKLACGDCPVKEESVGLKTTTKADFSLLEQLPPELAHRRAFFQKLTLNN